MQEWTWLHSHAPSDVAASRQVTLVRGVLADPRTTARLVWGNRDLRRINLSLLGSTVGDGAYATALAVYTFQWGGAGALGAFVAIKLALKALTVPFGVAAVDRLPPKAVLVSLDAVRAGLVAGAALLVLSAGRRSWSWWSRG